MEANGASWVYNLEFLAEEVSDMLSFDESVIVGVLLLGLSILSSSKVTGLALEEILC